MGHNLLCGALLPIVCGLRMEHLHAYIDDLDKEEDSDNEDEENKKKDDSVSHTSANEFDISSVS